MKKILLIFFTLFCTTHTYAVLTPATCLVTEDERCGANLEQDPYQTSCNDPSCTYCTGSETDENTIDHYQTTTQKQWTKVCDSVSYWCNCQTTVTYKCSANYYGTVTGPNISGATPTSVDCKACPTYATCDGGTTFTCKTNFTKNLDAGTCTCDGGFITGTGTNITCNKNCPQYATCDGTNFNCNQGFTKNTLTNTCTCNGGFIKTVGILTTCETCPTYATCNGGTNFDCKSDFIKSGNTCICKGYIVNNQCYICPPNATCKDGKITCKRNYYLDDNSCLACPYNGLTNDAGATNKTECFIPNGRIITLTNGTGHFSDNCYIE